MGLLFARLAGLIERQTETPPLVLSSACRGLLAAMTLNSPALTKEAHTPRATLVRWLKASSAFIAKHGRRDREFQGFSASAESLESKAPLDLAAAIVDDVADVVAAWLRRVSEYYDMDILDEVPAVNAMTNTVRACSACSVCLVLSAHACLSRHSLSSRASSSFWSIVRRCCMLLAIFAMVS